MYPLLLVTIVNIRFYKTPELAPLNSPSCPVAFCLSKLKDERSAFAVKSVNIKPQAFVQDFVQCPHCQIVSLLVIKPALRTPETFT